MSGGGSGVCGEGRGSGAFHTDRRTVRSLRCCPATSDRRVSGVPSRPVLAGQGAVPCGEGPSPAPRQPSSSRDGAIPGAGDPCGASQQRFPRNQHPSTSGSSTLGNRNVSVTLEQSSRLVGGRGEMASAFRRGTRENNYSKSWVCDLKVDSLILDFFNFFYESVIFHPKGFQGAFCSTFKYPPSPPECPPSKNNSRPNGHSG